MAFFAPSFPFIWLLASVTVKSIESAPLPSGNSYSFSKGGKTCSIQNGKLYVDGVFKRDLTRSEMDEVEHWSDAFNQFVKQSAQHHHGHQGHAHDHGGHNHDHNHNHNHDHAGAHSHHNHDHDHGSGHAHDDTWHNHDHGGHHHHDAAENSHSHGSSHEQGHHHHGRESRENNNHGHYNNHNHGHNHGFDHGWLMHDTFGDGGLHGKREINNDDELLFHGMNPATHFPHVCDSV